MAQILPFRDAPVLDQDGKLADIVFYKFLLDTFPEFEKTIFLSIALFYIRKKNPKEFDLYANNTPISTGSILGDAIDEPLYNRCLSFAQNFSDSLFETILTRASSLKEIKDNLAAILADYIKVNPFFHNTLIELFSQ